MDSIRLFLECNKIFFEVFSYTVVGIAGIIFSRYQCKANKRRVEMQKMQVEMQNKESQPIFKVDFSTNYDTNTDFIEISNVGKLFKSYLFEVNAYIEVRYRSYDKGINSIYYVPISDYYLKEEQTGNFSGKLLKRELKGNYTKYVKLYEDAMAKSSTNNIIFISVIALIKIEYIDIYDNCQTVYFNTKLQIDSRSYNEIIEESKKVFTIPFSIETVEFEDIIKSLKLPVS